MTVDPFGCLFSSPIPPIRVGVFLRNVVAHALFVLWNASSEKQCFVYWSMIFIIGETRRHNEPRLMVICHRLIRVIVNLERYGPSLIKGSAGSPVSASLHLSLDILSEERLLIDDSLCEPSRVITLSGL